jgi:nitronate monooxygenase
MQALFGVEIPVIQAPMAGAQGSALASAVSNAGGCGEVSAATLTRQLVAGIVTRTPPDSAS